MSNVYHDINSRQDFPNPADEVGGVEDTSDTKAHDYFAATVECVQIGRDVVTSLSDVPDHVFDVVWHMDLNKSLCESGVVAPWITDDNEQSEKTINGYEVYDVLSGDPNPDKPLQVVLDYSGNTFTVKDVISKGSDTLNPTPAPILDGSGVVLTSDDADKSIALAGISKHLEVVGAATTATGAYQAYTTYTVSNVADFTIFPDGADITYALRIPSNNDTFKSATTITDPLPDGLSYSSEVFTVTDATLFTSFPDDVADITYSDSSPRVGDTLTLSSTAINALADGAIPENSLTLTTFTLQYSPDETDVQLTRAVVAVTSAGVTNAMDTQVSELYAFLANLKKNDVGDNWYSKDNGSGVAYNKLSTQEQVKYGLAQLFDKNAQQNNLILGKEESITRLDVSKIKNRMAKEFGADFTEAKSTTAIDDNILDYPNADGYKDSETHFFHKFFSVQQLAEVLDAVHDKGSRIELTHSYIAGETYKVVDTTDFKSFPVGAKDSSGTPIADGAIPAVGDTFTLTQGAITALNDCEKVVSINSLKNNEGNTDLIPNGKRYKFTQGDTITAVVRICDTDSGYSDNNQHNNSDRWLITLHHRDTVVDLP